MKFLALSSLLGLGFLAQQSQATIGFDNYFNDVFTNSPTQNPGLLTGFNQGFQTLVNSFNLFGNTPSYQQNTFGNSYNNNGNSIYGGYTSNLKSQNPSSNYSPQQPTGPRNPLDNLDKSAWSIFDNQQQFCKAPRVWDGKICKCANNGCYLSGKCYNQPPVQTKKDDLLSLRFINRNFDGTQNNPNHPQWGTKSIKLQRLCPASYSDGKSLMWQNKPQPRDVSNLVGQLQGPIKESRIGLNMLFTIWGQFLDHDITLSPTTNDQPINIHIPRCDVFMDPQCTGTQQLALTRSIYDTNSQVRAQFNVLTAWVDAGMIYGSDKATSDSLRQFSNGKLKTTAGNLLPKDQNGQFVAGDVRVNQNVGLTCFHTVFMREHNRICDLALQKNKNLSDEEVFQIARNYVTALVQHITFDQYLPTLIGKFNYDQLVGQYSYDSNANPNIMTEFSSAAFRLGHPLINAPFKKMDNYGNVLDQLSLGEMFFNPSLVTNQSVSQFLNGLARTGGKDLSLQLVDDVRNFLFFPPNSAVKLDLFSFNLQRGRDHGICSVKAAREKLGLPKKDFKNLFENQEKAKCLQGLYQDTDNLDLWLGIIGQKPEPGAVLGELGIKLNALQFKNIRNGDKYWYENIYPESVIRQIKATSFGDVIKRNSGVKLVNSQSFKKL